jgi:hypothetical protein
LQAHGPRLLYLRDGPAVGSGISPGCRDDSMSVSELLSPLGGVIPVLHQGASQDRWWNLPAQACGLRDGKPMQDGFAEHGAGGSAPCLPLVRSVRRPRFSTLLGEP